MRTTERKSFLYQPTGRANETHAFIAGRQDGLYAINHVRGCAHGCMYPCYARVILKMPYEDWIVPQLFKDAPEIVEREIKRHHDVEDVELCFTTDPFMYQQPEVHDVSNKLIDVITRYAAGVTILTKGDLTKAATLPRVNYGITLISLSEDFRRKWEPGAMPYAERIAGLKERHDAGLPTWVSIEPYPGADRAENSVLELMENLSWVDKAVFGRWNYAGINDIEHYNRVAQDFVWVCQQYGIEYMVKSEVKSNIIGEGKA